MDKKIIRRIVGVLVVVALVIIILPLVANNTPATTIHTAEIKAPPFPDPQNEVSPIINNAVTENTTSPQPDKISASKQTNTVAVNTQKTPTIAATNIVKPVIGATTNPNQKATRLIAQASPVTPVNTTTLAAGAQQKKATLQAQAEKAVVKINSSDAVLIVNNEGDVTQQPVESTQMTSTVADPSKPSASITQLTTNIISEKKHTLATHAANKTTTISNLKKLAWVVQMGIFKNQKNAVNLTNALRAKGYKAFTYKTKPNGMTYVYVGPAFKQTTALALANQINHGMNMHGLIVTHNPLAI